MYKYLLFILLPVFLTSCSHGPSQAQVQANLAEKAELKKTSDEWYKCSVDNAVRLYDEEKDIKSIAHISTYFICSTDLSNYRKAAINRFGINFDYSTFDEDGNAVKSMEDNVLGYIYKQRHK